MTEMPGSVRASENGRSSRLPAARCSSSESGTACAAAGHVGARGVDDAIEDAHREGSLPEAPETTVEQ